jgi:hypothetical protein
MEVMKENPLLKSFGAGLFFTFALFATAANADILLETGGTIASREAFDAATFIPDVGGYGQTAAGEFLLDNGTIPNGSGRTVSGGNIAGGWEVFQPFDVPEPGWVVETIGVDGWRVQDPLGLGMLGRLHPDNGAGFADENIVLGSNDYFLSTDPFNSNWRDEVIEVTLEPGRYWMHWSDNGDPNHWSAIFLGTSGLGSTSRSGGNLFPAGPTALRIAGELVPEPGCLTLMVIGALTVGARRRK